MDWIDCPITLCSAETLATCFQNLQNAHKESWISFNDTNEQSKHTATVSVRAANMEAGNEIVDLSTKAYPGPERVDSLTHPAGLQRGCLCMKTSTSLRLNFVCEIISGTQIGSIEIEACSQ